MHRLFSEVRVALRAMRRAPLFTAVAVLSLALGIGANTAIFTLIDQIMLRLLPVKDAERLVMLYQTGAHNGSNLGMRMHSYPIYKDFQQKAAPLAEVLCRRLVETSVSIENRTERVDAEMVSGNYFSMLGVRPALGRLFTSEQDDRVYQGHPVVVLSYNYWSDRFARDPNILGRKILVNNYPMTVVGVSAAGFTGLDPAKSPQIRVPILMKPAIMPSLDWVYLSDRRTRWVQVFARLKPGYTVESARAPLRTLFTQIRQYEATLPAAARWSAYARTQFLHGSLQVERAAAGFSSLRNFSTPLVVLMCMVGLVLLIACANVANLLIARAFARQKEIAVRLAIGASRWQLMRQLLVESLLLSAAGAAAGIALASVLTRGLIGLIPVEGNPLVLRSQPDLRILLFTLALTFLTAILFGLLPAWQSSRPDHWSTLKDAVGSIASGRGSLFLRKGLVTAQVALSFLLLFGAGLFVRSLQNLKAKDTGFREMENLVTFQISPVLGGYETPERVVNFYGQLLDRVRAIPGVRSAALASVPLLHGWEWDSTIQVEGHQAKDGEDMSAYMNSLSPGYFQTMGIPILEGRDFDRRDLQENAHVAIVNQRFARHFFGTRGALGRHIGARGSLSKLDTEIVGVAADSLYEGPREDVRRQVFIPNWGKSSVAYYIRSAMPSSAAYAALRAEVRKLDASIPVYEMKTLAAQLDQTLLTERLIALLSAGFGLLATLLASVGLYGVMAFAVMRRTREMGVRMALGAPRGAVVWLIMREVLLLLAIGLALGIPAAFALGRYVATQLYGVKSNDPWIGGFTVLLLAAVAAAAGLIPARRASRIDPILALRYE